MWMNFSIHKVIIVSESKECVWTGIGSSQRKLQVVWKIDVVVMSECDIFCGS
jgi:hypothetical protein